METGSINNLSLNLQAFYGFAKLTTGEQAHLLAEKGIFLDMDSEGSIITKLYFLSGFFVEEIVCRKQNTIIEIIPYKCGYRIDNYLEVKLFLASGNEQKSLKYTYDCCDLFVFKLIKRKLT